MDIEVYCTAHAARLDRELSNLHRGTGHFDAKSKYRYMPILNDWGLPPFNPCHRLSSSRSLFQLRLSLLPLREFLGRLGQNVDGSLMPSRCSCSLHSAEGSDVTSGDFCSVRLLRLAPITPVATLTSLSCTVERSTVVPATSVKAIRKRFVLAITVPALSGALSSRPRNTR